jgi:hypothetical protein
MIVYEGKIRPYYPPYGQTWTPARQGFSSPPPYTGATPSLYVYTGAANFFPSILTQGLPFPPSLAQGKPFPPPPNRGKQFSSPTQGLPSTSFRGHSSLHLDTGATNSLHPFSGAISSFLPYTGVTSFLHPDNAGASPFPFVLS